VSKEAAERAGLTAKECASAYALEWRREVEGVISPGMTAKVRRKAVEQAEGNRPIPRRAGIWRALQALLEGDATHTGRLQITTRTAKDGPLRMVALHSRSDVREEVAGLPILYLDATMPVAVARHYLPRLEVLAEINPAAPHMRVTQVIGGWGKTSLVPSDKAAEDENRRRRGLIAELVDFTALHGGGNGLVVTYQDIEGKFAKLAGMRTGHFNAIAGLDTFRDVRGLFAIGRPLPDPRELRITALALTGRAIAEEAGQAETRGARMEDGTGAAMSVRTFADPDLEALRVAITEAEIIQAVGRGRGVNRTAADPLDVFLFADVATALPVARMVRWVDLRPSVLERMAARGLVLFGPTDAAKVYPDLFPSAEAARKAVGRAEGDFPDIPLGNSTPREMSGKSLEAVAYRPAGRGQQTRRALVAPERLETLQSFLEGQLGMSVTIDTLARPAESAPPASAPQTGQPPPLLDPAVFNIPSHIRVEPILGLVRLSNGLRVTTTAFLGPIPGGGGIPRPVEAAAALNYERRLPARA
jgi:hypothetical protein